MVSFRTHLQSPLMAILDRLVSRLVSVEPSAPAGIGRVPERRTNEHLSAVATETSIVERAFDQIMADADVPPALAVRIPLNPLPGKDLNVDLVDLRTA